MEQVVSFRSHGCLLFADLGLPYSGAPCVILSHGLESSKDGDKWLVLASRLYDAGFASLRFSYRGCGEGAEKSEGQFEDTTLSSRIEDLIAAIDFVDGAGVDIKRIGVVGSSFGGMVALAARDARIKAVVVMATPCRPAMAMDELFASYRSGEFFDLPSGRRLKLGVLEDMQKYDICQAAATIGRPLLIIQGTDDETVPVRDACDLYDSAGEPRQLEIIAGGNHSFDDPGHLERVVGLTLGWFRRYL